MNGWNDMTDTVPVITPTADSPCPFDFLVIRSKVLEKDILCVRSRRLAIPDDLASLPVFTWRELNTLVNSGVTQEDLPRLIKIRDEFRGVFVPTTDEPWMAPTCEAGMARTVAGFIPRASEPSSPAAPAPVEPQTTPQMELF